MAVSRLDVRGLSPTRKQPPFTAHPKRRIGSVVLLAASRLKQLHQVPGWISQKNLRAAGSGHDVIAQLHAGGTQSGDLARKIIHYKMDPVPATSFGAGTIRHGPPG
jgi:hypothetical protein